MAGVVRNASIIDLCYVRLTSYAFTWAACVIVDFADIETGSLEEKHKRDHFTQLVGACLVSRAACDWVHDHCVAVMLFVAVSTAHPAAAEMIFFACIRKWVADPLTLKISCVRVAQILSSREKLNCSHKGPLSSPVLELNETRSRRLKASNRSTCASLLFVRGAVCNAVGVTHQDPQCSCSLLFI